MIMEPLLISVDIEERKKEKALEVNNDSNPFLL